IHFFELKQAAVFNHALVKQFGQEKMLRRVIGYLIFRICCSSCLFALGISNQSEATSLILAIDIGRSTILALSTSALNSLSLNVASTALRTASTRAGGTPGGKVNNLLMSFGPITATRSSHFAFSVLAKSSALGTLSRPGQAFSPISAITLMSQGFNARGKPLPAPS